jgi:hypothetical protein
VSDLGTVLELLHTADTRWDTLRVAGREWRRPDALLRAVVRDRPELAGQLDLSVYPDVEERWRLWMAQPEKVRAEFLVGEEMVTAVIDGNTWWSWSPAQDVRTNAGRDGSSHGTGPGEALVRPAAILPALELRVMTTIAVLGRQAFAVRALPSAAKDELMHSRLHGLGTGADEYELLVDAERGVLLRAEARMDGEPFRILEVQEVAFDEPFAPETFLAPKGRKVEVDEPIRTVSLPELPGLVPFTVLVPAHPPVRWGFAHIDPPDRRWNRPVSATISYETAPWVEGSNVSLYLEQAGAPLSGPDEMAWEEEDGIAVAEEPSGDPPRLWARLTKHGTHIQIQAFGISKQDLRQLARTLVPLHATPPGLIESR